VSVSLTGEGLAGVGDEDAKIIGIFHMIYERAPRNMTADDARLIVGAWAENIGYESSDLTSDEFVAFVRETSPIGKSTELTSEEAMPVDPEVSITVSEEARTSTEANSSNNEPSPATIQWWREANERVNKYLDEQIAQMKADGTWEGSPMARMERWMSDMRKGSKLVEQALGIPDHMNYGMQGAAGDLDTIMAARNGLPLPAAGPVVSSSNHESLGTISFMGHSSPDAPDFGKTMFIVFNRETAATATEATFTLRLSDGQSSLNDRLDAIQSAQEANHEIPSDYTRFDLVDSAGQTVGMVMSKGWDDLAQDKAGNILAAAFGIFRSSADQMV